MNKFLERAGEPNPMPSPVKSTFSTDLHRYSSNEIHRPNILTSAKRLFQSDKEGYMNKNYETDDHVDLRVHSMEPASARTLMVDSANYNLQAMPNQLIENYHQRSKSI